MNIGILALQGDVAEHRRALADLGVDSRPVRRPDDLAGLDGIVLPGGESTTMSHAARLLGSAGAPWQGDRGRPARSSGPAPA